MAMTVKKLLETKMHEYEKELKELSRDLDEFERKYKMNSNEFYEKFEAGELGDAMDFVEWASLYDMFTDIKVFILD